MHVSRWVLGLIFFLAQFPRINAQTDAGNRLDSLKSVMETRIHMLEMSLQEVKTAMAEKEKQDELGKLLEEASQLKSVKKESEASIGKKFSTGARQQAGLNPNISLGGDFFGALSSRNAPSLKNTSEFSYGNNSFYLREIELSLIAPLDPFTRGKTFMSLTEGGLHIEEAYLDWLNLPANMNLRVGLFNAEFGILNRYHDHALPQFDRPKILTNLFTNANLGGFGVAGNFLLQPHFGANASLFDASVITNGNGQSFTNEGDLNLLYIGNFTHFYDINDDTFFEWRLGAIAGHNDKAENYWSYVGNLALNFKWLPVDRAKYRTFDWKTEFLYSKRLTPTGAIFCKGFYSSVQNKMNARWWLNGRLDYAELPYDHQQHEWAYTLGADFWQSEFVFVRFQYQFSKREYSHIVNVPGPYPDDHLFIVQVNWAMGPHKHEAY